MVSLLASANVMKVSTLVKPVSTTSVAQAVKALLAKAVAPAKRRLACACAMPHGMVPVVREAKAQRRIASRAHTKTASPTVVVAMESAIRLLASVLALPNLVNSSTVACARRRADLAHILLIGPVHSTSGAGPHARMTIC